VRIPDSWRVKLGRFYLDWAEKLPSASIGALPELREMRRHQRRSAQRAFQGSRFPDGVSLEISHIRMAEIFLLEDAEQLRKGLESLFPTLKDGASCNDQIASATALLAGLDSGGWSRVGIIVPSGKQTMLGLGGKGLRAVQGLPPEVKCIEVEIHKFLSSSIILTFDLHLTQDATSRLLGLHDSVYLSKLRFRKLLPRGLGAGGWSEDSPYTGVTDAILHWLEGLRVETETIVGSYLAGYFLHSPRNLGAKLPAVEVFRLKGAPSRPEELRKWFHEKIGWWQSLGFATTGSIYSDGKLALVWPNERDFIPVPAYRIVMLSEPDSGRWDLNDDLRGLIPVITTLDLLQVVRRRTETLRMRTFQKLRPAIGKRWRLGKLIRLSDQVQQESMIVDRVIMEFKQGEQWIRYLMSGLAALENLEPAHRERGDKDLQSVALRRVGYLTGLLGEHLSLIKKLSDGHLINLNMAVMYRLQRQAFWLTIVGALLAVLGVLSNWQAIKDFARIHLHL